MAELNELDSVVLLRNKPEHNLNRGDVGCVVAVYNEATIEVEFVDDEGKTVALITLPNTDVLRLNVKLLAS